jgi:hypothetical protein
MTKADWNYAMKVRKEKGETNPERYGYSIEMGISLCDRCKKRADCKDFPDKKKVLTVAFCTEYVDEVVLCKDCKYFAPNKACNLLCGLTFPTPNSYCSYGERKESK